MKIFWDDAFRVCSIALLLVLAIPAFASKDLYPFSTPDQQNRFYTLTSELRCLVCQNENLAESNAALANDLREQIHTQILNGKTDNEIIHYLVSRYGHFILYRPPLDASTIGLWAGPFLILLIGIFYLVKRAQK